MNKTVDQLVNEYMNIIKNYMKKSDILEIENTINLSTNKFIKVCNGINEKLNAYEYEYNHKYLDNGNLLIWKDQKIINSYVSKNFK